MKKVLLLMMVALLLYIACKKDVPAKDAPKTGNYTARFYGSYTKNGQLYTLDRPQDISIASVSENEILLSIYNNGIISSVLNKDKEVISGTITMSDERATGNSGHPSPKIYITGKWEKQQEKYSIIGFHQYVYTEIDDETQKINNYIVSGNFEISQK